jgi:hypothetical protein
MAPSPEDERFIDFASKDFGFLVKDFGFTATPDTVCGVGLSFTKHSLPLEVSLGWYKGEVDLEFQVLLENRVFRPYISRWFNLGEIVHHMDPSVMTNALKERPPLPRWALSAEDAHCFLEYHAMLVQKFCLPILNGDFAVLEAITWERRKEWGQTEEERYGKLGQEKIQQ